MNLPNYFLADLPAEAVLTPSMVREACLTLKRNRLQYLASRTTRSIIETLSLLARDWLDPENEFRRRALQEGPTAAGFSVPILAAGLDAFFTEITVQNLERLLVQELGHSRRLDAFVAGDAERQSGVQAFARGPELLVHVSAGNIPNPTLMSVITGLLLRSAQFVKCARGASFLPRLFAHSLYAADAKLASCLELCEWRGGQLELESVLFEEADCVTATGSDETIANLRMRIPSGRRFLGYGHRVSFAFVGRERLLQSDSSRLAELVAQDVIAWDQCGCLSPHVIYVERGGAVNPVRFAEMLAHALAQREQSHPRGQLPTAAAAHVATRREFYKIRADVSDETRVWCSEGTTAWTVIYEEEALFQLSCLNRFVYVKAAASLEEVLHKADQVRNKISTVGLAVADDQAEAAVRALAAWGATRICPLGQMQRPPLTWRHDGRPALADLVNWTDWEKEPNDR